MDLGGWVYWKLSLIHHPSVRPLSIASQQGRSGGGVYELAPESAALISLSFDAVPVGPSLQTPTSSSTLNSSHSNSGDEAEGDGEDKKEGGRGDVTAALTARLRTLEMQPSSLSLSGEGDESGGRGGQG